MPNAVAGLHPFQAARGDLALLSGRVFVGNRSTEHDGQRGDPRVRVNAEAWLMGWLDLTVIQEHEGFDQFADTGRTDEAPDGPVLPTAGANCDAARGSADSILLECNVDAVVRVSYKPILFDGNHRESR